jgi:hypothetical protein
MPDGIIISGFYFYSAYSYLMGLKALLAYSTFLHLPTRDLKQGSMLNQPFYKSHNNIPLVVFLILSKKHFRIQ